MVIDCFEKIAFNTDIEDGEAINPPNANGNDAFYVPAKKKHRGYEVVATFNKKYMGLFTALAPTWRSVIDELGNMTGYEESLDVSQVAGVAIEGWESVQGACGNGDGQWNYFVSPYVVNWARNDMENGNSAHIEEWAGHTLSGNGWGTGPYNVRRNADTLVAGKLQTALLPGTPRYDEIVTLAPPAASCECEPLSNPAGPSPAITECEAASMTVGVTATSGRPMQIDWGDGTAPATLVTAVESTHLYADPGRYVITVRFTDAAMEESFLVANVPCA